MQGLDTPFSPLMRRRLFAQQMLHPDVRRPQVADRGFAIPISEPARPFTGTGNDGYGSVSQGPLDFSPAINVGGLETPTPGTGDAGYRQGPPRPMVSQPLFEVTRPTNPFAVSSNALGDDYRGPLPGSARPLFDPGSNKINSFAFGGGIMSVLQPFGEYLTNQITETTRQRVGPFLDRVSQMATEEFGLQPQASPALGGIGSLPSIFRPTYFGAGDNVFPTFEGPRQPMGSHAQIFGMHTSLR